MHCELAQEVHLRGECLPSPAVVEPEVFISSAGDRLEGTLLTVPTRCILRSNILVEKFLVTFKGRVTGKLEKNYTCKILANLELL